MTNVFSFSIEKGGLAIVFDDNFVVCYSCLGIMRLSGEGLALDCSAWWEKVHNGVYVARSRL